MIKNYIDKDYADKAVEANSLNKKLYVFTTPTEFEKDVLDFKTQIIDGIEVQIPVMVDKEIPVYDEEGNQTGTEIIKVQSSHKEKYIEDVATLIIADDGYYVCYKDNYTDGTINENFNQEQEQKELERISMLSLTGADVERAIYKAKGMDFDDIIQFLEAQPLSDDGQPVVDIKALKIELKANNFYRGNPYVEQIGAILGFSSNQLTKFFETNDYSKLTEE